jgi:carbon-monoxide dehydrogenase medium subunit
MKPVRFEFFRAASLNEAIDILTSYDGDARVLAGGQSLVPMLNLRLARPTAIVDISRLKELKRIEIAPGSVSIGALVTHADLEATSQQGKTFDLLRWVASGIAYRGIRNRGTIGGSIAHCDPAADWLSCTVALNATVQIVGPDGPRKMSVSEFLVGSFTTALSVGEILTRIDIPIMSKDARWGYYKHTRKVGEFAEAIGCVVHDEALRMHRIVAGAISSPPVVLFDDELQQSVTMAGILASVAAAVPDLDRAHIHFHASAVMRALKMGGLT